MRPNIAGHRGRRRGRQPSDGGRSRVRSLLPVGVLAVCMAGVLYGNVSFYADKISTSSSVGTSDAAQPHAGDGNVAAAVEEEVPQAKDQPNLDIELPPVKISSGEGEEEGEKAGGLGIEAVGGVESSWDDDGQSEEETLGGGEIEQWVPDDDAEDERGDGRGGLGDGGEEQAVGREGGVRAYEEGNVVNLAEGGEGGSEENIGGTQIQQDNEEPGAEEQDVVQDVDELHLREEVINWQSSLADGAPRQQESKGGDAEGGASSQIDQHEGAWGQTEQDLDGAPGDGGDAKAEGEPAASFAEGKGEEAYEEGSAEPPDVAPVAVEEAVDIAVAAGDNQVDKVPETEEKSAPAVEENGDKAGDDKNYGKIFAGFPDGTNSDRRRGYKEPSPEAEQAEEGKLINNISAGRENSDGGDGQITEGEEPDGANDFAIHNDNGGTGTVENKVLGEQLEGEGGLESGQKEDGGKPATSWGGAPVSTRDADEARVEAEGQKIDSAPVANGQGSENGVKPYEDGRPGKSDGVEGQEHGGQNAVAEEGSDWVVDGGENEKKPKDARGATEATQSEAAAEAGVPVVAKVEEGRPAAAGGWDWRDEEKKEKDANEVLDEINAEGSEAVVAAEEGSRQEDEAAREQEPEQEVDVRDAETVAKAEEAEGEVLVEVEGAAEGRADELIESSVDQQPASQEREAERQQQESGESQGGGGEGKVSELAEAENASKEEGENLGEVNHQDGKGENVRIIEDGVDAEQNKAEQEPELEGELRPREETEAGDGGDNLPIEGEKFPADGGGGQENQDAGVAIDGVFKNGAVQGGMECAMVKKGAGVGEIVNIATWKDVPGDAKYRGPYHQESSSPEDTRYVTLEKDLGGFNNIRMTLESAVTFAAATGRTFVIPPPFQIWNMNVGYSVQEVALESLFSFDKLAASGRVNVITTEEFFEKEALTGNLGVNMSEGAKLLRVKAVSEYLTKVASQYENGLPDRSPDKAGVVMPRRMGERVDLESEEYAFAKEWLYKRELTEYREAWETAKVIHWRSNNARLLAPFYAFVLHADEESERYHNRLMRDLMHFPEEVYCKASQVISLLRKEDPSGDFSTFHIRRNDFLSFYNPVAIDPAEVLRISEDHLIEGEMLYIATDEKDRSLFGPFKDRFHVRFLDDYYEEAGVSEMNPNYIAMMEQIITSHGRTFTGCWFSTFTAYILRLRGYNGLPNDSSFYYYPPRKTNPHTTWLPSNPLWATEWPFGWQGIDDTGPPDPMTP